MGLLFAAEQTGSCSLKLGVFVGYFNSFVLSYIHWPMVLSLLFSFIKSMQVCCHCDVTHSEDIEKRKLSKCVQTKIVSIKVTYPFLLCLKITLSSILTVLKVMNGLRDTTHMHNT